MPRRDRCVHFDGVHMFAATKARDREKMGETISAWMAKNRHLEIVDWYITQSSDNEFHCVTMTLFYKKPTPS
jgi:hypothetical protein